MRLVLGDRKAMGGLETFGGSVIASDIDIVVVPITVDVVLVGKAGDRSFTGAEGRRWVDVHYGPNCHIK